MAATEPPYTPAPIEMSMSMYMSLSMMMSMDMDMENYLRRMVWEDENLPAFFAA
jgi:hypothetical protein